MLLILAIDSSGKPAAETIQGCVDYCHKLDTRKRIVTPSMGKPSQSGDRGLKVGGLIFQCASVAPVTGRRGRVKLAL